MATTTQFAPAPDVAVSARFAAPHPAPPGVNPLSAYVAAQRDAIVRNYVGVLAEDPDAVHDMRVAIRRLRATLRTYAQLIERDSAVPLGDELHWLAGLLGDVRDGDVISERLVAAIAAEPPDLIVGPVAARLHQRLTTTSRVARAGLREGLDSARTAKLLDLLDALVTDRPAGVVSRERLHHLAARAVRRADRRLDLAMRPPPRMAPSRLLGYRNLALHDARKAYKRARYAVEVLHPVMGRRARRLSRRLTDLQDVLGAYQDRVVAQELLRDYGMRAHLDGENSFSYGLLHARQRAEAKFQLSRLPRARRRALRAIRRFLP